MDPRSLPAPARGTPASYGPLVQPFPAPGPRVQLAYLELYQAEHGTEKQRKNLGYPHLLPHPWDPATCTEPELRAQLWDWLEDATTWLNHEYFWDPADMVPTCWPRHPHLVHELAVLIDQRRRAGMESTSDSLEEWHRYALPAFVHRARDRTRSYCEGGHQPWPGRSRHNQHTSRAEGATRADGYAADLDATIHHHAHHHHAHVFTDDPTNDADDVDDDETGDGPGDVPRLWVVDLDTGELHDDTP